MSDLATHRGLNIVTGKQRGAAEETSQRPIIWRVGDEAGRKPNSILHRT